MFSAPTHPDVSLETVSGEGKKERKTKISNSISLSTGKWIGNVEKHLGLFDAKSVEW